MVSRITRRRGHHLRRVGVYLAWSDGGAEIAAEFAHLAAAEADAAMLQATEARAHANSLAKMTV